MMSQTIKTSTVVYKSKVSFYVNIGELNLLEYLFRMATNTYKVAQIHTLLIASTSFIINDKQMLLVGLHCQC